MPMLSASCKPCFSPFLACLVVVSCLMMSSGCTVQRHPRLAPPSSGALLAPQRFLRALEERRQIVTSLRGLARVVYAGPQERGTARQAVAVAAPNRFRLEVFSPIGIAALSTCDGHTLATYFPQEKRLYRGAATPFAIARFTRMLLSSREVAGLLLGVPVFPLTGPVGGVRPDPDTDWTRIDLPLSDGSARILWFEDKTRLLRRWEMRADDGTVLAQVRLSDYRQVRGQPFPFEILLSDPQNQQDASIYYEQVELNPPLPDALFTLGPMTGVQEIETDISLPEER